MIYDENVFKEKANRKARKIWIVFAVLLSGNGALPLRSGHRLRHLLYLCYLYHSFPDRFHLHSAGDEPAGTI